MSSRPWPPANDLLILWLAHFSPEKNQAPWMSASTGPGLLLVTGQR